MSRLLRRGVLEHVRFLHELGVDALPPPPAGLPRVEGRPPAEPSQGGDVEAVRADLGDCRRCGLCESRRHIVFGVGNPRADLMLVGEGPGEEEDRRGEPFVGRAGQLLDKMIASIGLQRGDVYIANIVKCRPPGNRNPAPEEMAACLPFLARQIAAVGPRVIIALGKIAASALLEESVAITRQRGTLRQYGGIPLMPTFHPAYLLRQYTPANRRAVYDDLLAVRALLESAPGS